MSDLKSESVETTGRLVTINAAAKQLGVCRKTVYSMLEDGRLAWVEVRGRRRILLEAAAADAAGDSMFRTGEVAELCKVSTAMLRTFVREGQLEATRLIGSNHLRFTRSHVERFMRRAGIPLPAAWKRPADSDRAASY